MKRNKQKERIGIVLAGGTGSRLYPLTVPVNKQLLPVYDKPMVYYPLAVLMLAGIRKIVLVSSPEALPQFKLCLGDGKQWGLNISYAIQPRPEGIPQAFLVAERYIKKRPVALILGDNILYGTGLPKWLQQANAKKEGATIFSYPVSDPSRYGIVTLSDDGKPIALEEKPVKPSSNLAVTGLYFYDEKIIEITKKLKPSSRGELEITDVNRAYMKRGQLDIKQMARGWIWLDGGTHESLYDAGQFVRVIEERSGLKIACLEEIAYNMGYISLKDLMHQAEAMPINSYGNYLRAIVASEKRKPKRHKIKLIT